MMSDALICANGTLSITASVAKLTNLKRNVETGVAVPLPYNPRLLFEAMTKLVFNDPNWALPLLDTNRSVVIFPMRGDDVTVERKGHGWVALGDPYAEIVTAENALLYAIERASLAREFMRASIRACS